MASQILGARISRGYVFLTVFFRVTHDAWRTKRKRDYTIDVQRSIFYEIRGVWIADETLSRVFDISSQSKQKLRSNRRSKIVEIYAN